MNEAIKWMKVIRTLFVMSVYSYRVADYSLCHAQWIQIDSISCLLLCSYVVPMVYPLPYTLYASPYIMFF